MYQEMLVSPTAAPTLWCVIKCGGACAAACELDGPEPGPADVIGAGKGFSDFGGK